MAEIGLVTMLSFDTSNVEGTNFQLSVFSEIQENGTRIREL